MPVALVYRGNGPGSALRQGNTAVTRALKMGLLVPEPCQHCDSVPTEAHHDDYLQPLAVRWLCVFHHQLWHQTNGRGRNAHASFSRRWLNEVLSAALAIGVRPFTTMGAPAIAPAGWRPQSTR